MAVIRFSAAASSSTKRFTIVSTPVPATIVAKPITRGTAAATRLRKTNISTMASREPAMTSAFCSASTVPPWMAFARAGTR